MLPRSMHYKFGLQDSNSARQFLFRSWGLVVGAQVKGSVPLKRSVDSLSLFLMLLGHEVSNGYTLLVSSLAIILDYNT